MTSELREDQRGVTSPLGTAVLVGTVIVLAVGLSVMVRVFTTQERQEDPPPVAFSKDETSDTLVILHAEDGLKRSDFEIRLSVAGDFEFGGPVQPGGDALPPDTFVSLGGAANGPEDADLVTSHAIYLCAGPAPDSIRLDIRHIASNAIILRQTFISLAACP